MSGVAVIRYKLANNATLTAQVPAARIIAGALPLNTALPAIAVTGISGVPMSIVSMVTTGLIQTDRVQVTVYAKTYPTQKSILALVRAACGNASGTVNGVTLDSILPGGEGPDFYDADAVIYEQSMDLIVRWVPA